MAHKRIYGLLAEFGTPEEVLAAAHRTKEAGYKRFDAYSPIPVEGLAEAVGFDWTALPSIVLAGGILGGCTGFGMCYYANVISYPWNIAGKPPNSWPMWIAITFELTILGAALCAVLGMLALTGLVAVFLSGCRLDMHVQPKYLPYEPTNFFSDGRSERQPVPGTVARGQLHLDDLLFTGMENGTEADR